MDEQEEALSEFSVYLPNDSDEMGSLPSLTLEQELRIARLMERGNTQALEILVNIGLRLVDAQAEKYSNRGVPRETLVQYGMLALIRAIDRFDAERGLRFTLYAAFWIRQITGRIIRDQEVPGTDL